VDDPADEHFNVIIRNGTLIDGTGEPGQPGDVGIVGDRITYVGDLSGALADCVIDAKDRVVAPGFIDAHTHDDRALLLEGAMLPKTSQGVTSVIAGNCGVSLAPLVPKGAPPPPLNLIGGEDEYCFGQFADLCEAFEAHPPQVNGAYFVGHSTLRFGVMGNDLDRPATAPEVGRMRAILATAMEQGAIGLSSGLAYPPAAAATTDEVAALAEVAGQYGGLYSTHLRDEGDQLDVAMDEAFEIAERGKLPLILSHHKCHGRDNFGRSVESLAAIESACDRIDVGFDVYPYVAGSTALLADFVERAERVVVTWSDPHPEASGRDLADVAAEFQCAPLDAVDRLSPAGAIYFMMAEDDVQRILSHPMAMVGSDGLPHDQHPHPRLWGTFPRVLGHYARDLGLFSLEEGVRRMTSLTAAQFGLKDRGMLKAGAFADVVIFDPKTIAETATYESPASPAFGIGLVMVNGAVVHEDGKPTVAAPGRLLRREVEP
jgi:N-acyl-D-amino-acid deacylase